VVVFSLVSMVATKLVGLELAATSATPSGAMLPLTQPCTREVTLNVTYPPAAGTVALATTLLSIGKALNVTPFSVQALSTSTAFNTPATGGLATHMVSVALAMLLLTVPAGSSDKSKFSSPVDVPPASSVFSVPPLAPGFADDT